MSIKAYRDRLEKKVNAAMKPELESTAPLNAELEATARAPGPEAGLLATLADDNAPPKARLDALAGLKVLVFASPTARQWRPRFIAALRSAVDDPGVRIAALHTLTTLGDVETRQRLLESVQVPEKELVPKSTALQLLSRDPHGDAIREARKTVDDGDDREAVTAALPMLARDPDSGGRLRGVIADKKAPAAQRRTAAQALFALEGSALESVRRSVGDDPRLKAHVEGLLVPKPPATGTKKKQVKQKKTPSAKTKRVSAKKKKTGAKKKLRR